MTIEAITEHLKLREALDKHGISTWDIDKLLNLLSNAKENGFDSRNIVTKLRSIKRLEKKQDRLKNNCETYSKQLQEYKEILPLTEDIAALQIGYIFQGWNKPSNKTLQLAAFGCYFAAK